MTKQPEVLTTLVVPGSGVGSSLFIIFVIDLQPQGLTNDMTKYADDTSLLMPEINTVSLEEEFDHLQVWVQTNKLVINMLKTKEIVFHRPNPRGLVMTQPLSNIERVKLPSCWAFILWITLMRVNKLIICLKYATSGYTFLSDKEARSSKTAITLCFRRYNNISYHICCCLEGICNHCRMQCNTSLS